jgi:hypothetical protein
MNLKSELSLIKRTGGSTKILSSIPIRKKSAMYILLTYIVLSLIILTNCNFNFHFLIDNTIYYDQDLLLSNNIVSQSKQLCLLIFFFF